MKFAPSSAEETNYDDTNFMVNNGSDSSDKLDDSRGSTDSESRDSSIQGEDSKDEVQEMTSRPSSCCSLVLSVVKNTFSAILLGFCIVVVSAAFFQKQTSATGEYGLHPVIAFCIFWVLLLWLALMEGGLNVMVGLQPVDKDLYSATHKQTYGCTRVAHKGNNIDRFIVGRQYLDLMVVFLTNFMVSAIDDANVLSLPEAVSDVFLASGVAVILVTIVIGQLVAQINSASCMLDFVNNYVMLFTTYAALTVEASGILHSVYLIQIVVSKIAGKSTTTGNEDRPVVHKCFFWIRVVFSVSLLLGALVITFKALFEGSTTMWEGVPAYASVLILVVLILVVGMMEGLQIAFMSVIHMPEEEVEAHPVVKRNCELVFQGQKLQAFLVGRQIFQTIIMFVIARITTLDPETPDENIFGANDGVQQFFNTGILGALISTIVASLSWRVLASSFPLAFLSNPFGRPIIQLCLLVESTGICSIAWSLATLHRKVAGLKEDSYYLDNTAKDTEVKEDNTDGEEV